MAEHSLVSIGLIIVLGFAAQWISWRIRIPSILFLLLGGIAAGPLLGYLNPGELFGDVLVPFVSLSVAIILFEGGLTLKIGEFKTIGRVVTLLISLGVLITWAITAASAYWLLGLNVYVSVLLGAVLSVTGPTVIGPLLRNIRPQKIVGNVLKWEGILIDPIGALLTILVFEVILIGEAQQALMAVALGITKTIFAGLLIGGVLAYLLAFLIKKYWIPDYLHGTAALAFVVIAFLISNYFQAESGLLATTIMGIVLTNQKFAATKKIKDFKENLTLFIIPVLFIVLSASLTVDNMKPLLSASGIIFLLVLIFIGRPLSVFASAYRAGLKFKEKLFLAWMAPRGIVAAAVSSVFALKLAEADVDQSEYLVSVTFLVIMGTVIIYGFTSPAVAKWLKVSQADPQGVLIAGGQEWSLQIAKALQDQGFNVAVIDTNRQNISRARMMGLIAYNESIISDNAIDTVNMEGIGQLLALTSNDEVNSLSALQFSEVFEKSNLYQLVPNTEKERDEAQFSPLHLRGRFLFGKGINFNFLSAKFEDGGVIKSTRLTEEFTFEKFQEKYDGAATLLFLITQKGNLIPFTSGERLRPQAGNTIVALVNEKAEAARK